MQLGTPRVRTRTVHAITIPITDGPILEGDRRGHQFRVTGLRIGYVDGELNEVTVEGPRLRADGSRYASGEYSTRDYLTARGKLIDGDVPEWVRDAVGVHSFPISRHALRGAMLSASDPGGEFDSWDTIVDALLAGPLAHLAGR